MAAKRNASDPVDRLALVLRDSLIAAWVRHNPQHDSPDFVAVRQLGQVGYRLVAMELVRRGVKPPLGE